MDRRLDIGRVFEQVFRLYREQAALLLPAALLLFVPAAIVNGLTLKGRGFLAFLVGLVSFVASFWYQGMVVEAVRDMRDGRRDFTFGTLLASVSPVIGPLILVGVLAAVGITIGLIFLIVPGLILLTLWAVVVPVVVIERPGVLATFGRSMDLVRGNAWRVFGVIVLLFLLEAIVGAVLGAVARGISESFLGYAIATLVAQSLIAPLTALAASVVYFELREHEDRAVAVEAPATAAG